MCLPIYFIFHGTSLHLMKGLPPVQLEQGQRLTKAIIKKNTPIQKKQSPLIEAIKYANAFNEPSIETMAQVGARFGVSRARVSQVMNLLRLDERIKFYLLNIEDSKEHNYFSERKLRKIALVKDCNEQYRIFKQLQMNV